MMKYDLIKKHLTEKQYVWLVTGAAGFIGSNLVETLLNLNQKVIGLDDFSTGYQKNIDDIILCVGQQKSNFTFMNTDIRNFEKCKEAVKNVDFVLHQAALGSVPRSIKEPLLTNSSNVDGFLNMFVAAKDAKIKRFVYASSSSVYGDSPTLPKVETDLGNPLSPYAASKMTDELYAKTFANCYDLEIIGLRYFNVFGKRQDPNGAYAAVIPKWINSLMNKQETYIYGDGETSRDFCYIDNVVQANILSALTDNVEAINQAYNIAVGERITLNELFQIISDLLPKEYRKKPIYQDFRKGDIPHSLADITKAKKQLNYHPTHSVKQGLELAMAWYLKNSRLNLTSPEKTRKIAE